MDRVFNAMLRGFGFGLGRRAANRVPLWLAIGLFIVWHLTKG
jgi:hypothetical protein